MTDGPRGEAARRAAVSRAYYAVFLELRERFALAGTVLAPSGAQHRRVIMMLRLVVPDLAAEVDSLRLARLDADYNLASAWSVERSREVVTLARSLLARSVTVLP